MLGQSNEPTDPSVIKTVINGCFLLIGTMGAILARVFQARNSKCDELEKEVDDLEKENRALEKENGALATEIALLKQKLGQGNDER